MRPLVEILGCFACVATAVVALVLFLQQWPSAAALEDFDALPDFNYLAAADDLRGQQRFAEAAMVARAGLSSARPGAQPQLQAELTQINIERNRGSGPRPVPVDIDAGSDDLGDERYSGSQSKAVRSTSSNEFSPYRKITEAAPLRRAEELSKEPGGVFALWIGQDAAATWLKNPDPAQDVWLIRAAKKGRAGIDLLLRDGSLMLRPHPLLMPLGRVYGDRIPGPVVSLLNSGNPMLTGLTGGALFYLLAVTLAAFIGLRRANDKEPKRVPIRAGRG